MGLDVGAKTIGVAISDELGLAAHPTLVLARKGTKMDVAQVVELVAARDVRTVVIGLPLELSGAIGRRATRVRVFIDALRQTLPSESPERVDICEWDERFSTTAVERVLIDADLSRRKRKRVIDKQAAAYILQGWLDANREAE